MSDEPVDGTDVGNRAGTRRRVFSTLWVLTLVPLNRVGALHRLLASPTLPGEPWLYDIDAFDPQPAEVR